MDHDVIIIGGGPAGLAAATWLGRYRRAALIIDSGEYRNAAVEEVHGYLGDDPVRPSDLRDRALDDLARYECVHRREGEVSQVAGNGDGFDVAVDGETLTCRRLVLATGVRDVLPDVAGIEQHYGVDVYHCPPCDAYEARDHDVAVIGWAEQVPAFAINLLDWVRSVRIVTEGRELPADGEQRRRLAEHGIDVVEGAARELIGEPGDLRAIELHSGERVEATYAFFSIHHEPVTDLAEQLGCELDGDGYVTVDHEGAASVEGVWAAGDLTPGMQLVAVAAAQGAIAGVSAARSFHGESSASEASQPAPDPSEEL